MGARFSFWVFPRGHLWFFAQGCPHWKWWKELCEEWEYLAGIFQLSLEMVGFSLTFHIWWDDLAFVKHKDSFSWDGMHSHWIVWRNLKKSLLLLLVFFFWFHTWTKPPDRRPTQQLLVRDDVPRNDSWWSRKGKVKILLRPEFASLVRPECKCQFILVQTKCQWKRSRVCKRRHSNFVNVP